MASSNLPSSAALTNEFSCTNDKSFTFNPLSAMKSIHPPFLSVSVCTIVLSFCNLVNKRYGNKMGNTVHKMNAVASSVRKFQNPTKNRFKSSPPSEANAEPGVIIVVIDIVLITDAAVIKFIIAFVLFVFCCALKSRRDDCKD